MGAHFRSKRLERQNVTYGIVGNCTEFKPFVARGARRQKRKGKP